MELYFKILFSKRSIFIVLLIIIINNYYLIEIQVVKNNYA